MALFPFHADVHFNEGLNMQAYFIKAFFTLFLHSTRTLVEPSLELLVRNFTWFESSGNTDPDISHLRTFGTLGVSIVPLFDFFDPQPIEHALQRPLFSMESFFGVLAVDLLIDFEPNCAHQTSVTAFGRDWTVASTHCATEKTPEALFALVSTLPHKLVVVRGFRPGAISFGDASVAPAVDASFRYRPSFQAIADKFVKDTFGQRPFVCAHWRRGDRAYRVEMKLSGVIEFRLTAPQRLAAFLKSVMKETGIEDLYLSTNSGSKAELEAVSDMLGLQPRRCVVRVRFLFVPQRLCRCHLTLKAS